VLGHASLDLRALRGGARQHDLVAELSGQGRVHLQVSWAARGQLHEPLARLGPRHAHPSPIPSPGSSADHAVPLGGVPDRDNRVSQRQRELQAPRGRTPQAQPLSVPLGPRPLGPPPPTVQVPESRGDSPLPRDSPRSGAASQAAAAPAGIVVKGAKGAREAASASSSGKRGGFLSRNKRS
jgi:hypothetical protein